MLSYAYRNEFPIQAINRNADKLCIMLDSGAFTVFRLKKEVAIEEYCAFLRNPPFPIFKYFALDRIGDNKTTERNLQIMLDKGLKPVPVFQRGQAIDILYKLLDKFPLVGIGGLAAGGGDADTKSYLKYVLERKDINKRQLHILGIRNLDFLRTYKPFSADTTEPLRASQFGEISFFDKSKNAISRVSRAKALRNKFVLSLANDHPELFANLMTKEGWQTGTRPINNSHFLASLIALKEAMDNLQRIGCKLFLPYLKAVPLEKIL